MSKDIFTKTGSADKFSEKKSLTNKPWKKHIIQTKTLKRKYVPKIIWRKITTKNSLQRNPYRKSHKSNSRPDKLLKRIFFEKISEEESVYQESLEEISLPKSMWQSSLPKNP